MYSEARSESLRSFLWIVAESTQPRIKPGGDAGAGQPPDKTHLLVGLQNILHGGNEAQKVATNS